MQLRNHSSASIHTKHPVQFDDVQALARFGHGHLADSQILLLTIKDRVKAGRWLQTQEVSCAATQDALPDTAIQIAFSPEGLFAMNLPEDILAQFSDEFIAGMSGDDNRSRRLGDVDGNAPGLWRWGHHDRMSIHIILLLYARQGQIDDYVSRLQGTLFKQAFNVARILPTDTLSAREPFGFIDGISQPKIDWQQEQFTDVHSRSSYSNLLAPGEVVLGYPNEYGQLTRRPLIDPLRYPHTRLLPEAVDALEHHDLGMNGSYLIIRQLCQDVGGFSRFTDDKDHGNKNETDSLAAAMVGRHRDGKPLIEATTKRIPGISDSEMLNRFNYDNDLQGLQCPVGAHIRRSNPRTGDFPPGVNGLLSRLLYMLGFKRDSEYEDLVASSRFHRILRRGRTFSEPEGSQPAPNEPAERVPKVQHMPQVPQTPQSQQAAKTGLQFICLAGNILRQFEFVQSAWSVSSAFAGTREQRDPITAHRRPRSSGTPADSFMQADERDLPRKVTHLPQFVTVCGGGYYFLPGLRAIQYLACIALDPEISVPVQEPHTGDARETG